MGFVIESAAVEMFVPKVYSIGLLACNLPF
jgi:hypothetical protein